MPAALHEQLVGLEQIFELLSQRANLHGITEGTLDSVVALIDPLKQPEEVVSAAALVAWCRTLVVSLLPARAEVEHRPAAA